MIFINNYTDLVPTITNTQTRRQKHMHAYTIQRIHPSLYDLISCDCQVYGLPCAERRERVNRSGEERKKIWKAHTQRRTKWEWDFNADLCLMPPRVDQWFRYIKTVGIRAHKRNYEHFSFLLLLLLLLLAFCMFHINFKIERAPSVYVVNVLFETLNAIIMIRAICTYTYWQMIYMFSYDVALKSRIRMNCTKMCMYMNLWRKRKCGQRSPFNMVHTH